MFRIAFFVDEKRLGRALFALVGLAHGSPEVVPVVNVEKKKGNGLTPKIASGSSVERFGEALKPHRGKTVKMGDFAPLMKGLGLSEASRGYLVSQAVKAHLLKRHGKGTATTYTVL